MFVEEDNRAHARAKSLMEAWMVEFVEVRRDSRNALTEMLEDL